MYLYTEPNIEATLQGKGGLSHKMDEFTTSQGLPLANLRYFIARQYRQFADTQKRGE